MMSDGRDGTQNDQVEHYASRFFAQNPEAVLHTVGFGDPAHFARLQRLSQVAGGEHHLSSDNISLKDAFDQIAKTSGIGTAGEESEHCFVMIKKEVKFLIHTPPMKVLEGDHPMVIGNNLLGHFNVKIQPRPAGMNDVLVKFDVDHNGILSVSAIADGHEHVVVISNKPGVLNGDQMKETEDQCNKISLLTNLHLLYDEIDARKDLQTESKRCEEALANIEKAIRRENLENMRIVNDQSERFLEGL
ncbi:hypothetical protein GEMRC1_013154 [Eukaryota sp. GEM-RC1]